MYLEIWWDLESFSFDFESKYSNEINFIASSDKIANSPNSTPHKSQEILMYLNRPINLIDPHDEETPAKCLDVPNNP